MNKSIWNVEIRSNEEDSHFVSEYNRNEKSATLEAFGTLVLII
jgi:hypothetical protein